jgi:DNA-binding beta-propeller fold protein YncE
MKVFIMALIFVAIITTGKLFFKNGHFVDNLETLEAVQTEDSVFPYNLSKPSKKFKMPDDLDEISGLSYVSEDKFACIQDNKGMIYVFDIEKREVTYVYKFGKAKDCEDVAVVNNTAYVLQSNGHIWQIDDFEKNNPFGKKDHKAKKYKPLLLSKENNTEGLAFDSESNSLLIACKGSQELEEHLIDLKGKKAIYRFDLSTKTFSERPAYVIDLGYLDNGNFELSGIAVHPITGNIYVITSVDKMLIILNQEGKVIAAKKLDKKIFKQPEGICFNPDGDLFISNESHDKGKATILKFKYKP